MRKILTILSLLAIATTSPSRAEDIRYPRPFQYTGVRSSGFPLVSYPGAVPPGSYPPTNPLDSDAVQSYARYPMVSIDLQPTFNRRPDILNAIKAANPNCKVLVYVLAGHWYTPAYDDPTYDLMNKINSALVAYDNATGGKAFLYDTNGVKWVDNYSVNLGDRNVINAMEPVWNEVLANPKVDGLMIDCLNYSMGWTTPYDDGINPVRTLDIARAGYASEAEMDAAFASEAALLMIRLRANNPTKIIIANSNVTPLVPSLTGRMWEGWPGQNPGEYPATWQGIYEANKADGSPYNVYKTEHHYSTNQYVELALSEVYSWQTMEKVRYLLGSATLGDGWSHYAQDRNHPTYGSGPNTGKYVVPSSALWWYDEYSVNVTKGRAYANADTTGANTFWLGKATAVTDTVNGGLRRRRFENGVVLVNPTGGQLTYTSSIPLKRIKGRDTYVNTGAYGYSFDVPYHTALFLVNAAEDTLVTGVRDVKVRPNMTSAAVSAWVTGDADTNATVRIFYRRFNAAAYDSGMVMVPRRGGKQDMNGDSYDATNYEGRIMHLANGRKYQYYVEVSEQTANGMVFFTSPVDTFRVEVLPSLTVEGIEFAPFGYIAEESEDPSGGGTLPPIEQVGDKIYVRQNGGSDDNSGESWALAVATIGKAIEVAQNAGDNASILLYPGHYHESANLNWDTAPVNVRRYFLGMSSTPDSVVICGANPLYEAGLVTSTRRFEWQSLGNGHWRAYFPDPACKTFIIGTERLVRKVNQHDMNTDTHGYHGWYWTNDSLYVRLNRNLSPVGRRLYFGAKPYGINVARRNWRISNIKFQYQGYDAAPSGSGANIRFQGYGVSMGLNGHASGTIIDNCRFIGQGQQAIYAVRGGGGTYQVDSVTVVRCTIDGLWTDKYDAGKTRDGEAVTVFLNGERSIFNNNTLRRLFNGVQPTDESVGEYADTTLASWSEVTNNSFKNITDDAIELDSYQSINRLIAYNTIDSCGRAISFSPLTKNGPVFVFYNLITNCSAGLKLGGGSYAPTVFYHNTIIGKYPVYNPGGIVRNLTFRNNIIWGRNTPYTLDFGSSFDAWQTSTFNYNVYDSTSTTAMALYGGAINVSLAKLRSTYMPTFETNGKQGNIGIQSLPRGDYRLRWPSNAIDNGCRLPGINTSDRGPMYYIRPDMGCYEFVPALKKGP